MPRNKYPEVTRQRILDVAEKLFFEKGYENTTIQDIIDALGDLSKGAIYHHFKSKVDIIDAVTSRMYHEADLWTAAKLDDSLSGLEKLRLLCRTSVEASYQETLITMMPNIFDNPKILSSHVRECFEVVPDMIQPFIEEGNVDGSLSVDCPKEMAGMLAVLLNIWLNPMLGYGTVEEYQKKFLFLQDMLQKMGIPILEDGILERLSSYIKRIEQ